MQLDFTADQEELRSSVRSVLEKECARRICAEARPTMWCRHEPLALPAQAAEGQRRRPGLAGALSIAEDAAHRPRVSGTGHQWPEKLKPACCGATCGNNRRVRSSVARGRGRRSASIVKFSATGEISGRQALARSVLQCEWQGRCRRRSNCCSLNSRSLPNAPGLRSIIESLDYHAPSKSAAGDEHGCRSRRRCSGALKEG